MEPVLVDFATRPAELANAVVRQHRCVIASSYVAVAAGGYLKVSFTVEDEEDVAPEAALRVTVLGAAVPVDLSLNDEVLTEGLSLPDDGDPGGVREYVMTMPGKALRQGVNVLRIRNAGTADLGGDSLLRVRTVAVEAAEDAGRAAAEHVRAADEGRGTVRTFATERRTLDAPVWEPGPRLLLRLGQEGEELPARLSWRATDGAESAVAFRGDLSGFQGHFRTADGAIGELRGTLTERRAVEDVTAEAVGQYFAAEEEHDGMWRAAGQLCLLLDDDGAPVERVTWSDRKGDATSLTLRTAVTGGSGPAADGERRDVTGEVSRVEASDEFREWGEVAANLLLKDNDKWLAHRNRADLEFVFGGPFAVTAYTLTSANDFPDRDPSDWTLEGSRDGKTWKRLDARQNERFGGRFDTREFSFANAVAYRHYRLSISANSGGHETQLCRVRFFDGGDTPPQPGVCDFIGYRQRAGTEPVGYRGTIVPGPALGPEDEEGAEAAEPLLAGDFTDTARRLQDAARLLDRLTRNLRS
ncbi:discoidin domain-containing protein [Streptomyces sp. NPDC059786]|uniref:discoidin domain-containing protein n=1 Tax=Streptomyces sp. NPDC059786 TaxID=3346946 RepID=UPI003656A3BA